MKVTLVMATTINGFVAGEHDETDWIKDFDVLYKTVTDFGTAVMGKRTYDECIKYDAFPYKGAWNIVITHDKTLLTKNQENVLFTDASPKEIITIAQKKGLEKLLIIGGGHINGSFLKEGLINEIILDVHPFIMAKGIRLFESEFQNINLQLVSSEKIIDQVMRITYNVIS